MPNIPSLSNKRIYHYLSLAKSACQYSDYTKARLGAIVVYKGKVLSVGWNSNKTSPVQKELNRLRSFDVEASNAYNTLHAEVACLLKVKDLDIDWGKASIFVYRIKKDGNSGLAKPCPGCGAYIKSLGIRNIFYSTNNGWAYERIDN